MEGIGVPADRSGDKDKEVLTLTAAGRTTLREMLKAVVSATRSIGGVIVFTHAACPAGAAPASATGRSKKLAVVAEVGEAGGAEVAEAAIKAGVSIALTTVFPDETGTQTYKACASRSYVGATIVRGGALVLYRKEAYSRGEEQLGLVCAKLMCFVLGAAPPEEMLLHRVESVHPTGEDLGQASGLVTEAQMYYDKVAVLLRSKTAKLNQSERLLRRSSETIDSLMRERATCDQSVLQLSRRVDELQATLAKRTAKEQQQLQKLPDGSLRACSAAEAPTMVPVANQQAADPSKAVKSPVGLDPEGKRANVGGGGSAAFGFFQTQLRSGATIATNLPFAVSSAKYKHIVYRAQPRVPVEPATPTPPAGKMSASDVNWNGRYRPVRMTPYNHRTNFSARF